ncbi:hypothetical protein LTR73_009187 [Friedmanniomyces endolithicus]|nr:hypothetical protein LTR73_009187 [Friedmanniomyces endolithicus]
MTVSGNTIDQSRIVEICDDPRKDRIYTKGRVEIVRAGTWAIKFGKISSEEISNQLHAQDLLDPAVVRIPRIHAHFHTNGVDYVVMKYVDGEKRESIRDLAMIRTIAGIVNYMHTFTRDVPGPVNGGACYGPLWSEDDRSVLPTKEHLEDYVNSRLIRNVGKFTVATTPMAFTHLDISARNLLIKGPCIWLLDWEFAGYFPRSAEIATLRLDVGKEPANLDFYHDLESAIFRDNPLIPQERNQVACWRELALNHIRIYR